jgi:hypothetical protein
MRRLVIASFCLVLALGGGGMMAATPPPPSAGPTGTIATGLAKTGDGMSISLGRTFSAAPVVIANAQMNNKAYSCSATSVTTSSFVVSIRDENKQPVAKANVQWIAFVPSPDTKVIGGTTTANHDQQVSFASMGGGPVILCNAENNGAALNACAVNNSSSGFTAAIRDQDNATIQGATLRWMAVVPNSTNKFQGGVATCSNNDSISFGAAFARTPKYWVSAQYGREPYACYGVNGTTSSFKLLLCAHNGPGGSGVWTQWLAWSP